MTRGDLATPAGFPAGVCVDAAARIVFPRRPWAIDVSRRCALLTSWTW